MTFLVAATGPMPMMRGSTPASSPPIHVAIGVIPSSLAFSSLMTITAAAASFIPDELPAVTTPSFLKAGLSFARDSFVVPGRLLSSVSNMVSPFLPWIVTGTISSLKRPEVIAFSALSWLHAENSSSSSRVRCHSSAMFSAVMPM